MIASFIAFKVDLFPSMKEVKSDINFENPERDPIQIDKSKLAYNFPLKPEHIFVTNSSSCPPSKCTQALTIYR